MASEARDTDTIANGGNVAGGRSTAFANIERTRKSDGGKRGSEKREKMREEKKEEKRREGKGTH